MAKRKNKKNQAIKQDKPQKAPVAAPNKIAPREIASSRPTPSPRPAAIAKAKSAVSMPVFFSGMFLTLVLGIYLGTLAPEIIQTETRRIVTPVVEKTTSAASEAPPPHKAAQPEPALANLPGDLAAHVGHIKSELAKHPENAGLWTELGDLYFDASLPQLAIEAYGKALALNPKNADVLTDMGIMYRELGELKNALDCFRNASAINPDHTQSLYNQGLILSHDLNDRTGAAESWEKLLRINPDAISPNGKPVRQMLEELK